MKGAGSEVGPVAIGQMSTSIDIASKVVYTLHVAKEAEMKERKELENLKARKNELSDAEFERYLELAAKFAERSNSTSNLQRYQASNR